MIYEVSFRGEFSNGLIVVTAESREKAFNLIKRTLEGDGLWEHNENISEDSLREYSRDYEGIILYENSDN